MATIRSGKNVRVTVNGNTYDCDEYWLHTTSMDFDDAEFERYLQQYQLHPDPLSQAIELQELRERARKIVERFIE